MCTRIRSVICAVLVDTKPSGPTGYTNLTGFRDVYVCERESERERKRRTKS